MIAGIALWKSFGLLRGSVLEEAYDKTDRAMRPLGLRVAEHPEVTIEVKGVTPYRLGPAVQGALVLRWNGVRGGGGPRGVSITRRSAANGDWLLDLWLAERLADALDRVHA